MAEAVAFADAVTLGIGWLQAQYVSRNETAYVGSKIPRNRPDRLTRVSYGGGVQRNLAYDAPRLVIDSWDLDEVSAGGLHRLNRALFSSIKGESFGGVFVSDYIEVGNPGFYPDPATNLPRFQFTAELLIEGTAI